MAPNINRNAYKFWVLLVVYQLLAYVLSHEICVEHLCHQTCQGFYFGDDKYTLFNLGYHFGNDRDEDVCVTLNGIINAYCTRSRNGWIRIPVSHHSGLHTLSWQISDIPIVANSSVICYIKSISTTISTDNIGWITVTSPAFGTVKDGTDHLFVEFRPNKISSSQESEINVNIIGIKQLMHASYHLHGYRHYHHKVYLLNQKSAVSQSDELIIDYVIPLVVIGSWFFEFYSTNISKTIQSDSMVNNINSVTSLGYIEYVLPLNEILSNRKYRNDIKKNLLHSTSTVNSYSVHNLISNSKLIRNYSESRNGKLNNRIEGSITNVCIWGSDKMDGQKMIWYNQAKYLDQNKIRITYILTSGSEEEDVMQNNEEYVYATIENQLMTLHRNGMSMKLNSLPITSTLRLILSPFLKNAIELNSFYEIPSDGSSAFAEIWDGTSKHVMQYVLERLMLVNYKIENVTPNWVRNLLQTAYDTIVHQENCHIMVYGNNRGHNDDALIVAIGKAANIPSVTELLNLFVDVVPDIIIGPSRYAIEHPSVMKEGREMTTFVVISPGVDLTHFNYLENDTKSILQYHMPIIDSSYTMTHSPFVVIGYVGRLSVEKNVGLFVLAAHEILKFCPFCRFTIVGDGLLRPYLEELCDRLEISWAVKFTGWLGEELPSALRGMDIIVNPSLRAWSETFCISNIEAMAMKIPLVTFAVGGIGEYIHPLKCKSEYVMPFEIAENAVVVNIPTPEVIADVVKMLILNSTLRAQLGESGYDIVRQDFTVRRQIEEYESLYVNIHASSSTKEKCN